MKNRVIAVLMSILLMGSCLAGCGSSSESGNGLNTTQQTGSLGNEETGKDGNTTETTTGEDGNTAETTADAGTAGDQTTDDNQKDSGESSVVSALVGKETDYFSIEKQQKPLEELSVMDLVGKWQLTLTEIEGTNDYPDLYGELKTLSFHEVGHTIKAQYESKYVSSPMSYNSSLKVTQQSGILFSDLETAKWYADVEGTVYTASPEESYEWEIKLQVAMLSEDEIVVENIPTGEGDYSTSYYKRVPEDIGDVESAEIIGQGGQFIQLDHKVIYRAYSANSVESNAVGGEFQSNARTDGICGTFLNVYDMETGDSYHLDVDGGSGDLFYYDGKVYYSEYSLNEECYITYRKDLTTFYTEQLSNGRVVGLDESCGYYYVEGYDSEGKQYIEVFEPYSSCVKITPLENQYLYFLKAQDGYGYIQAVLYDYEKETITYDLFSYDLSPLIKGEDYGNFYCMYEEELEGTDSNPNVSQIICDGTDVYFVVEKREGTGHYFADGFIIKATANQENSGTIIQVDNALTEEGEGFNEIMLKNGKPVAGIDSMISKEDVLDILGYKRQNGDNIFYMVESLEHNGDYYDAVVNRVIYNPSENIGWRDAFGRLETQYVRIDPKQRKALIMDTINCEYYVSLARAWGMVKGSDIYLVWQPYAGSYYDDDQFPASVAFATKLSEEAYAYLGSDYTAEHGYGSSTLEYIRKFFEVNGAVVSSSTKSSDYYGCVDITEEMDSFTPLFLSITFDHNGKIINLWSYN